MSIKNPQDDIALRPATPRDADFLFELKRKTLREYITLTWGEWDESWQRAYFDAHFDPSKIQMIQLGGEDIGMIAVTERPGTLFLELVEISPEYQNRGIGSYLIRQLLDRARELGLSVRLHVLRVNPARALYERLGFRAVDETETHYVMETRT
jgi:ribosomal protein S18 acetylase RimI-like enzyme